VGGTVFHWDYLVVGSGIAGLTFALRAAQHGKVAVITKRTGDESNTRYAQGGIAAVLAAPDTFDEHVADTLRVGDGLCRREVVDLTVQEGPDCVRELAELGVPFDRDAAGAYDLGREGGHSQRRVVHATDFTGLQIQTSLLQAVGKRPNITLLEHHMAVDLLTTAKHGGRGFGGDNACFGAFVLDVKSGTVDTHLARATILASGGAGKVYLYTTNPDTATGDGIAMAYRAGARVANMEFIQFHPTCLYHQDAKSFLISEALRGEGGILKTKTGHRFMDEQHAMGSLAPRDVIARAIDAELKRSGADSVFLDMTHLDPEFVVERFPNIHAQCLRYGLDMRKVPLPVVPATHYTCGGVDTDTHGHSSVKNLYAIGETACTGLHGACRLASNSLLEALVFARRSADDSRQAGPAGGPAKTPLWEERGAVDSDEAVVVTQNWDELRRTMWNYVGIVRSTKRLERAQRRIEILQEEIREYYWRFRVTGDLIELRNLAMCAALIVNSAMRRRESRGLHYTIDFPGRYDEPRDTILVRGDGPLV
jgi:L-aspartate oxidase